MSYVPIKVPENMVSVVNHLLTLAETEPLVADHIAPIITRTVDYAMTSGKATDPDVWIRAFQGAITYVETLKVDDEWLRRVPINRST